MSVGYFQTNSNEAIAATIAAKLATVLTDLPAPVVNTSTTIDLAAINAGLDKVVISMERLRLGLVLQEVAVDVEAGAVTN